MLGFLRNWIEQIALAVIIASIFEMILPSGKSQKYIKMVLGIFIIFNIISPFVDANSLYNFDVNELIENYTENIETSSGISTQDKIEEAYIKELETDIINTVEKEGYNVSSCDIDAVIYSDDNNAGINSINIVLLSKNNNKTEETSSDINSIENIEINVSVGNQEKNNQENNITQKDIKDLKKTLSKHYEIDEKIININ